MKVTINVTENFRKAAKPLLKKYASLHNDLLKLQNELTQNPYLGVALGNNAYKIRLKISSKGKGKSGGARVITLVQTMLLQKIEITEAGEIKIYLLTIYDKSNTENISDSELKELIDAYK